MNQDQRIGLALGVLLVGACSALFFRNETGFGGNNGLTDFKDILGFSLTADSTRVESVIPTVAIQRHGHGRQRRIIHRQSVSRQIVKDRAGDQTQARRKTARPGSAALSSRFPRMRRLTTRRRSARS